MNTKALLKTVINVIKQYGTPFEILRDEYVKNSLGCMELVNENVSCGTIIAVIDNSKTSTIQIKSNDRGRAGDTYTADLYTFWDKDFIPEYDKNNAKQYSFSGKRVHRGLYKTSNGKTLNADVNGSLNIMKKCNVVDLSVLYARGEVNTPIRIRVA